MPTDIVIPRNNEREFIEMAGRLGFDGLVFCYEPARLSEGRKKVSELQKNEKKIMLYIGCVCEAKHVQRMQRNMAELFIVPGSQDNRLALEMRSTDVVFDLETSQRGDFLHHRNSGLNQVLAAIAKEKEKLVAFSLSTLLQEKRYRSIIMGRMSQNIMLCRKYKLATIFASFAQNPYEMRAPHDMVALLRTIGMDALDAKRSLEYAMHRAEFNRGIASGRILGKGIEVVE